LPTCLFQQFRVRDSFQSYGSLKYYMHLNKILYIRNGLDKPEVLITRMIVCIDEFWKKISVGMAQPHLGTNRNHRKVQGVFSEMQVNKFEPALSPLIGSQMKCDVRHHFVTMTVSARFVSLLHFRESPMIYSRYNMAIETVRDLESGSSRDRAPVSESIRTNDFYSTLFIVHRYIDLTSDIV